MRTINGAGPLPPDPPNEPATSATPPASEGLDADSLPSPPPEAGLLDFLGRFRAFGAAAIAAVAVIVNIGIYWEKQWFAASVAALIVAMFIAIFVLVHRTPATGIGRREPGLRGRAAFARNIAAALVIGIPLATLLGFAAYKISPIAFGSGTTIAIAQFEGPPLPAQYANCRPSNMLADRIGEATSKFDRRFSVYELPYSIDSNGQWAHALARWRGWLHNADVVVFGSYALRGGTNGPNQMFIDTHVESVLGPRPAWKGVPLDTWDLPNRLIAIDALCGNGPVPAFINDAKRLALSLLGLQLLQEHNYDGARDALGQAVGNGDAGGRPPAEDCIIPVHRVGSSTCTPVLAFYLATLYQQLGDYGSAERAYVKAEELPRAAPRVDLGELYAQEGQLSKALVAFNDAVKVEPTSIPALAARSIYEREAGKPRFAAIDLDRAERLGPSNQDDYAAISRALYQRGGSAKCAIAWLETAIHERDFDAKTMVDTLVIYGRWLYNDARLPEANVALTRAIGLDADNVKANYTLGLIAKHDAQPDVAAAYFVRAMRINAYSDEELLDQGNSAAELHDDFDALTYYNRSLAVNHHAVYALLDRALLYKRTHRLKEAEAGLRAAVAIHPHDPYLRGTLAQLLREEGRSGDAAITVAPTRRERNFRTSDLDQKFWSNDACRYVRMDVTAPG